MHSVGKKQSVYAFQADGMTQRQLVSYLVARYTVCCISKVNSLHSDWRKTPLTFDVYEKRQLCAERIRQRINADEGSFEYPKSILN